MFEDLLNSTIEVTLIVSMIALVLFLLSNLLNRNYNSKLRYWIWLILAVRLIIPLNFSLPQAPITLPTLENKITYNTDLDMRPDSFVSTKDKEPEKYNSLNKATPEVLENFSMNKIFTFIWLLGISIFTSYQLFSYVSFKNSIKRWSCSIKDERIIFIFKQLLIDMRITKTVDIKVCKKVSSPMMTGFIKPVLLLPKENYRNEDLLIILKHELIHYKRHDVWYKLLILCANTIHWFNPIIYLMAKEANKDIELSCDAEIVKDMDKIFRKEYSEMLLNMMKESYIKKTSLSNCFYGDKNIIKQRFTNILDMNKKKRGIFPLSIFLVITTLCSLLVGCSSAQNLNIETKNVTKIEITGRPSNNTFSKTTENLEDIKKIVDYLSSLNLSESKDNPSPFERTTHTIKLHYTDGTKKEYLQLEDAFFKEAGGKWLDMSPKQGKKFASIVEEINGDTYFSKLTEVYGNLPSEQGLNYYVWHDTKKNESYFGLFSTSNLPSKEKIQETIETYPANPQDITKILDTYKTPIIINSSDLNLLD